MTKECSGFYYLIDDSVEFRPEEHLLYSRINGEKITLFVAASSCFQLLLNQQGLLVSQQELFDAGWKKNAVGVSNNTFYQNILTLRKALKLAGYEQPVIKTVPRQGLTIPLTVPVAKIVTETVPESTEKEAIAEEVISSPPLSIREKKPIIPHSLWIAFIYLPICIGVLTFTILNRAPKPDFFANFNYIGKIDRCSVYLYSNRTSLRSYMQFIAQKKLTCNKQSFVYFTTYPLVPRVSVIRCERPFSPGVINSCISEYHLTWKYDE